jgi:8-oxoguanine deaminase
MYDGKTQLLIDNPIDRYLINSPMLPNIGTLKPGKAADLVAFRIDDLQHAGAQFDPVAALVACAPARAWLSIINGRAVAENGALLGVDLREMVVRHNRIASTMLERAGLP